MNTKLVTKGFTIIEVVLVLAIAGLIFLMVFIALPALQSGQRDTARKSDVSNVASAVTSYTNNNRGKFPDTAALNTQLGASGTGTDTTYTSLSTNTTAVSVGTPPASGTPTTVPDATIIVYKGKKCGDVGPEGSVTVQDGTTRQFVVVTRLEGGNKTGYCLDS
jgi:type IV pilus assembly protein PilA